ncbi:MAG: V-type ATP synthase subunit E [Clostridiaceae bacterium]
MVTIEQKLSLFSKLLNRSMDDKFKEAMEKLKKEYEEKLRKNREAVYKEAEDIINRSVKKAEAEKIEMINKIRISSKKEYMDVKEKHLSLFMDHLKEEIENFIQSEKYGGYLVTQVDRMIGTKELKDSFVLYMTRRDYDKYSDNIRQELLKSGRKECSFKMADDSIIGGFIAEDAAGSIRLNFSVKALLEDNMPYIMQTLFQAIEAGETDGRQ